MSAPGQVWSVPIRLEDVPEAGRRFDLAADPATRTAVARTAGLEAVPRLEASFEVIRRGRDGLQVAGSVSATVRQTCVVTLEPVENEIDEPIDLTFVPHAPDAQLREAEAGTPDPPEALVNGTVDLGAIATEFLILGIDRYPRRAGAVFSSPATGEASAHPFDALAALKKPR